MDHVAGYVGQSVVAAFVAVDEALVIDAELMQQRSVQVMHVHRVASDVVTELVGLTKDEAPFDAAAGNPDGEAPRMVVAAKSIGFDLSLPTEQPGPRRLVLSNAKPSSP